MQDILSELPPLSEKDCFHVTERYKSVFTFPIHQHREMEINFVENGSGLRRVVGDSVEIIGDFDLVFIAGSRLEHAWDQNDVPPRKMREITIQFSPDLIGESLISKNQFTSIRQMFKRAELGLAFSQASITRIYGYLMDVIHKRDNEFGQFLALLALLHEMSVADDSRQLATSSFANAERTEESRRIALAKEYVQAHFKEVVRLADVAELVAMNPVAFSHFFQQRAGKSLTQYLIDYRLGHVSRELLDTSKTISEICYDSGFNNIANFGRLFKKKYGLTPRQFRSIYKKNKYVL